MTAAKNGKGSVLGVPVVKIGTARLTDLRPAPYNPRRISKEAMAGLKASIQRFGLVENLIANRRTGHIISGHQRHAAALALGIKTGPVAFIDVDIAEEKRLNFTMNNEHIQGEWTADARKVLDGLKVDTAALDTLSALRLDRLELDLPELPADLGAATSEEEERIPDPPKKAITKAGDLWELGEHRLFCGDVFDEDNRRKLLGRDVVPLVVTDPPYAIYGSSTGIASSIADDKMVRPFFANLFGVVGENLKKFGHLYVFCDWRSWSAIWEGAKRAEITPKNVLVWDKGGGLGSNYANCYEMIGFFSRVPMRKTMAGQEETGQRSVLKPNVLRFNRPTGADRKHNAAKPVPLVMELLENSSDAGDLVVDYFMGSGTTIIAAQRTGRRARGFEIEPRMCDVIVERWQTESGEKARRV